MRLIVKTTLVALTFGVAAWARLFQSDKEDMEFVAGKSVAEFFYGVCDLDFQAFLNRNRNDLASDVLISTRFERRGARPDIYPVLKEEEELVISFIERAFAWNADNYRFEVTRRPRDEVSFQPLSSNGDRLIDNITLDKCGYLIGDNYPTRLRHRKLDHRTSENRS